MKSRTYEEFVEKFEPKKTTDDCYTPKNIYDAIAAYVETRYSASKDCFVRPFYPGGDYENFAYAENCIVVDNPPFSIISEIIKFYVERNIKFFLFAPALTLLSPVSDGYCGIAVGASITYENGAKVSTSFATNLENNIARTSPTLYKIITEENKKNERNLHRELPKYEYPDNIITATFLQKLSKYGVGFSIPKKEAVRISTIDEMKKAKKTMFGKGLLCSNKTAAEKAAAEKAAAEKENKVVWTLSDRELKIIEGFVDGDQQ